METMVSTEVVRVRGLEIGKGMPKICVPVAETSREEILRAAREAGNSAADLLEWRADCYEEGADRRRVQSLLLSIRREIGDMPLLFTFRTREEGGAGLCDLSPRDYLWLNYCALESGAADLADVELRAGENVMRTLVGAAHSLGRHIVGSCHDFQKTPETSRMRDVLLTLDCWGADILKLAVMPRKEADVERLRMAGREASVRTGHPVIAIAMGELGKRSRTQAERFGSAVTFGCLGRASAPGQVPVEELAGLWHQ